MHYHTVEDESGDTIDLIPFCSDACNRAYCKQHGLQYQGWYGCHEGSDYPEFCANCGVYAGGLAPQCDCHAHNVIVNRFPSDTGERCEHGNWIQLPASRLE